jgi:hypothetical protein
MRRPRTTALNHFDGGAIGDAGDRLSALLRANNIDVRPDSWMDQSLRVCRSFAEADRVAVADLDDVRRRRARMADVHLMAAMLANLAVPAHPAFARHLRLLAKADHSVVQPAERRSHERDRFFELLVASAVAPWADAVDLDEPDVLARRGDTTWAIACKSAGAAGDQLVKNVKYAADQVGRSAGHRGVVVVRVTDLAGAVRSEAGVPAHLDGPGPTFTSHDAAADGVYEQLDAIVRPEMVVQRATRTRPLGAPNVAAVVFLGHVLCDVLRPEGVRITMLPYWRCFPDVDDLDEGTAGFVDALWRGFQPWSSGSHDEP